MKLLSFIKNHKLLTACIAVIVAARIILISVITNIHSKQADQIKQSQIGKCYMLNYQEGYPVTEIYAFKEGGYARLYIKYGAEDKSRVLYTSGSLEDCDEFDISISLFGKITLNGQYIEVNEQNIIVNSPRYARSWSLISFDEASALQQEVVQLKAVDALHDACEYAAVGTIGFLKELQETLQPSPGITSTASDEDYITAAQSLISERLKNPSSAIFNSAYVEETDKYGRAIVYLDVSAQNSFGGYVRSQYYVCIQGILADTYTYNSLAYSVDSPGKLAYLKTMNNWGEDKTEKVDFTRFRPNSTPNISSVEACGFTLERYEYTSSNATYVAFIEPKTQYVVASEIILSKEYFILAPDEDRSPISKAIRGTMRTTSSMLYKHEDVFSAEKGLLQNTPLFSDKYCYYAVEQNGFYHITVTNIRALGCDETNYWTPLSAPQTSHQTNSPRTCPQCGQSEPNAIFTEDWTSGDPCFGCLYASQGGGSDEKRICKQCGADCTFRGLEEDGRCEDCYFGNNSGNSNASGNNVSNNTSGNNTSSNNSSPSAPAACAHSYTDATCTKPKTCTKCGATTGSTLDHTWKHTSCATPKACSVCGTKQGSAPGHQWKNATCTQPETCSACGATQGSALGHSMELTKCVRCDHTDYSAVAKTYSNITAYDSKTGEDLTVSNVSISSSGVLSFTFNGQSYSITIRERAYDSMTYFDCYQNGSKLSNAECRIGDASYYNMLHFEWNGIDGHRLYFCAQ